MPVLKGAAEKPGSSLGDWAVLLHGGIAGCVGKSVTAPFARLAVLAQTSTLLHAAPVPGAATAGCAINAAVVPNFSSGSLLFNIRELRRHQGFRGLWKGNLLTCLHRFPSSGTSFVVERALRTHFPGAFPSDSPRTMIPGTVAGMCSIVVCYPLEVVRVRIMANCDGAVRGNVMPEIKRLIEQGPARTYRGVGTSMAVCAPSVGICFATYRLLLGDQKPDQSRNSSLKAFVAGGVAGVVGSVLTFPLDLLRRRLQVSGMKDGLPQRRVLAEASHILATEGPGGFWRGLQPEVLKVFFTMAVTFTTFEALKERFAPH